MPKYQIQWKGDLTNITDLKPKDEEYEWKFTVKCTKCHEEHATPVTFTSLDECELPNSRSINNLVMKCKFCNAIGSMDIIKNTVKAMVESNDYQDLVVVEGRGWEPLKFLPGSGFVGTGNTGSKFEIELNENEWVDYDEAAGESVEILNILSRVIKA